MQSESLQNSRLNGLKASQENGRSSPHLNLQLVQNQRNLNYLVLQKPPKLV
jgi:hypothetical protein